MKKISDQPAKFIMLVSLLIITVLACQTEPSPKATSIDSSTTAEVSSEPVLKKTPNELEAKKTEVPSREAKEILYPWVDQLSIRDAPNRTGKVVARVGSNDELTFTGKKSEQNETIVLRGVAYEEPWLEVFTKDKKEGWVFGGAVKKKGEKKGNPIINDTQFYFENFGSYNLKDWDKKSIKDESGGDAEILVILYQRGEQFLEITKSDGGEYGYSRTYKVMDASKQTLLERILEFQIDPFKLTETVTDFTIKPARIYSRSQILKKHFMQLNAKPLIVNNENWMQNSVKDSSN